MQGIKSLAQSRKFWLTMVGAIVTACVQVLAREQVLTASTAALFIGLVNAIAKEDAAGMLATDSPVPYAVVPEPPPAPPAYQLPASTESPK